MSLKDWFVPAMAFVMFIYFMTFIVMYAIKIGGPNVTFHEQNQKQQEPVTDAEKHLKEISKEFRERLQK